MTTKQTARDKLKVALADLLRVPPDDPTLEAVTVAYLDAATSMYQVVSAGHGSVKIYISQGWVASHAKEITTLPDPAHRRPAHKNNP